MANIEYITPANSGIVDWAEGLNIVADSYYEYADKIYKATESHTASSSFDNTKFTVMSEETKITDWAEGVSVVADSYYEYNDILYKATESHTATSSFDTTKFKAISTSQSTSVSIEDGETDLTDTQTNVEVDTTNGNATINLPTASGKKDKSVTVRKSDDSTNTVEVVADGVETIDGESSEILTYQNQTITLVSDGTNWYVLNETSSDFARIVASTTEPSDTTVYWLDLN